MIGEPRFIYPVLWGLHSSFPPCSLSAPSFLASVSIFPIIWEITAAMHTLFGEVQGGKWTLAASQNVTHILPTLVSTKKHNIGLPGNLVRNVWGISEKKKLTFFVIRIMFLHSFAMVLCWHTNMFFLPWSSDSCWECLYTAVVWQYFAQSWGSNYLVL